LRIIINFADDGSDLQILLLELLSCSGDVRVARADVKSNEGSF